MRRTLLGFVSLLALCGALHAQVAVQQSATHVDTGAQCQTAANPAVNTQNTLTFNVPAGQSLYLTSIYLAGASDATGAASGVLRFTTTNLQSVEWDISMIAGAGQYTIAANYANPNGIVKSAVGPLSVTIVSPGTTTHTAWAMTACGYFAP